MKIESCEHQVLLTLNHEAYESFRRILYCEYNEPYGFCPQEFYDENTINEFVAKMYYEEHFGGEDNEEVWELIRETREKYYQEFGMEYAYGSETNQINRLTDEAMVKEFQERLEQCKVLGEVNIAKLYLKALKIMEC